MTDFIYLADFLPGEVSGGAEQNDAELINILKKRGHSVETLKCDKIKLDYIKDNKDKKFIISNFIWMFNVIKNEFSSNGYDYVIYEHDHKYLMTRDPSVYENYIAPPGEIINKSFYENANAVFVQSTLHGSVMHANLNIDNIVVVGGNLWSEDTLDLMEELSKKEKEDKISIMDSNIEHKNTKGCVKWCEHENKDYVLLGQMPHREFLEEMSKYETFLFSPLTLETLSRIVVEARMMNCKVITNPRVGAASEEWFTLKGMDLINKMRDKREEIPDLVMEAFSMED